MNHTLQLDRNRLRAQYRFSDLVDPLVGVIDRVSRLAAEPTAPDFEILSASLGDISQVFPHVSMGSTVVNGQAEVIGGAGSDVDLEIAWVRAVVEAAERYASLVYDSSDFTVASAEELGAKALDLDNIPRCSDQEYADPRCTFVRPNKGAPMRWIRGVSLISGQVQYLPAVMAHLFLSPWPAEAIWPMISTGTAAHTQIEKALVSAICECIERDAVALTWLCRLPLPRLCIDVDKLSANSRPYFDKLNQSLVKQLFFDATTDLGVPTVYSIQLMDGNPSVATLVGCATEFKFETACAKVIREAAPARCTFQMSRDIPKDVCDFTTLYQGATYLGQLVQRCSFSFLLDSARCHDLREKPDLPETPNLQLQYLIRRLRDLSMEALVVDLTPDELRDVGLWVVKVIIPGLIPMSVIHRARFLGHPRLYTYPQTAGFMPLSENEINPDPQPFA